MNLEKTLILGILGLSLLLEKNDIGWAWWTIKKVGDIDSPFSVKLNPGYQKILDYWKGEGDKAN